METLLQILGELLLQIVFEAITELGFHGFQLTFGRQRYPLLSAIGILLSGCAAGGVSLLLFPHSFVETPVYRLVNLLATPVVAGLIIALIGNQRTKRNQLLTALDHFNYA